MIGQQFTNVSFYIVAHADDWQLFMQPTVYYDLTSSSNKIVFVITTAGDAGLDNSFWMAREEGMKSSIRFCLALQEVLVEASGEREFKNHTVNYWSLNNATCYFLRLPDGNLDGSGFSTNHYESLAKLKKGEIDSITAVDSSTNYASWLSFHTLIQSIITFESNDRLKRIIHYLNPDTNLNPNDHQDHVATGAAIQDMPIITTLEQALYVGYSVRNNKKQITAEELFWKSAMFSAYEKAVFDSTGYSTLKESITTYIQWCLSTACFSIIKP